MGKTIEIRTRDGSFLGSMSKQQFERMSREQRVHLCSEIQKNKQQVLCRCVKNPVVLKVSKTPKRKGKEDEYVLDYYLKNNEGEKEKHDEGCPMHASYTGSMSYKNTWKKNEEDGSMEVLVDESLFKKKKKKQHKEILQKKDEEAMYQKTEHKNYIMTGENQYKATLRGLVERFNVESWTSFIQTDKEKTLKNFLNHSFGYSHQIKLRTNKKTSFNTLNSYWREATSDEIEFIYIPLKEVLIISDTFFRIVGIQVNNGNIKRISCEKEILEDALKRSLPITSNKEEDFSAIVKELNRRVNKSDSRGFLVCGFAKRNKKGYLEFVSLEIMQVSKQGLWSESSYEAVVYSKLTVQNRVFTKCIEEQDDFNDWVPDILFLDTEDLWYGEIFGINNESYDDRKLDKIAFAEKSNEVSLWYWEAYKKEKIPEFPKKKV